ncbi:MAG: hypothetical protein LBJ31_02325 [Treponema sp.]|jgi:hypothetical protein|nr:hypothetical protein [Treponema sp.]
MFWIFDTLIRDFLGKYGRIALDFCLENSLVIGLVVIGYGYLLIRAQNNLEKVVKKARELAGPVLFEAEKPAALIALKGDDFWDTIRAESAFPFVAHPTTLLLRRPSAPVLKRLLERSILYEQKNKFFGKKKK